MASPNANNRRRGVSYENYVAKRLGGRKVGQLNLSWDVEVPRFARVQAKKWKTWPSLNAVEKMIDAIPDTGLARIVVLGTAPGRGRRVRSLIVFDFDDFCEWYGAGEAETE